MQFNLQPISNVLGVLMIIFGLSILSCGGVALYYEGGDSDPIIKAGLVTFFSVLLHGDINLKAKQM